MIIKLCYCDILLVINIYYSDEYNITFLYYFIALSYKYDNDGGLDVINFDKKNHTSYL